MPDTFMAAHLLRRAWIVLVFAVAAGAIAWWLVHDDPKVYERTLISVILPSRTLEPRDIPDAMRSLNQQNSQISVTMATAVGSPATLRRAARAAFGTQIPRGLELAAGVRPGTDAITIRVRGPRPAALEKLAPFVAADAAAWVRRNYSSYRLELFENEGSGGPIAPRIVESVALAALLVGAIALVAAYVEGVLRRRRVRAAAVAVADAQAAPPLPLRGVGGP